MLHADLSLAFFANATVASDAMRSFLNPAIATLCVIATLVSTFFLVIGGVEYMSSRGKPEKLEHAKRTLKNALIGLALVIAAAALTAILTHAYSSASSTMTNNFPTLAPIQQNDSTSFWDVVTKAIIHVLQSLISSIGEPFVKALSYFTNGTPLMGENSNVFNLWLTVTGIADGLFILVVALLGFQIMSFSTLGFDELDIKQVLPQLAFVFLLMNTSIFAIDAIIGLSNGMIHALQTAFPCESIWDILADVTKKSSELGLGGLLIMIAFLILTVMLLVYYVGRLITLYIGAILSPIIMLLYLIPAFKDFAINALKIYLMVIFVLFVQTVIMQLASSMFSGMLQNNTSGQPNTLMALIVGLATVLALLKTQGVMQELSHAASTPRAAREIAGSFIRGISYIERSRRRRKGKKGNGDDDDSEDTNQNENKPKKRSRSSSGGNSSTGANYSDYDYDAPNNSRPARVQAEPDLKTGETKRLEKSDQPRGKPTTTKSSRTSRSKTKKDIKT